MQSETLLPLKLYQKIIKGRIILLLNVWSSYSKAG
jgi:hypothetical protein